MTERVVYETPDYKVRVGVCRLKTAWEGNEGYLVVNKRTGVIEGEVSVEHAAIRTANDLQRDLTEILADPTKGADPEEDFEAVMKRLAEQQDSPEVSE